MKTILAVVALVMCGDVGAVDQMIHYGEKIFSLSHSDIPTAGKPPDKNGKYLVKSNPDKEEMRKFPDRAWVALTVTELADLQAFYAANYSPALAMIDPDGVPVYPQGAPRDNRALVGVSGLPIPYRMKSITAK